jgi:hypothetical protein
MSCLQDTEFASTSEAKTDGSSDKKIVFVMEYQASIPFSQQPANRSYLDPVESSPHFNAGKTRTNMEFDR